MMDPAEAIARLSEASERLGARTEQLAIERQQREAARAKLNEQIAEARRSGEHGRDWQVLQQRIDLGQTSEFQIVQGLDFSAEARAVRAAMGKALGQAFEEQEADGPSPVAMDPGLAAAQERLVATLQRLREFGTPEQP
ncbi:hypothetical protein [Leucobacter iarius]|uniref:Uncharacterized protein n=1 Tax=Leucobacter iarius TaxID=333963 RepID=A0ABN2L5V0_9MICO